MIAEEWELLTKELRETGHEPLPIEAFYCGALIILDKIALAKGDCNRDEFLELAIEIKIFFDDLAQKYKGIK